MKLLFLNPPTLDEKKYIREGRCLQLTSSWAAIWPPLSLAIMAGLAKEQGHEAEILDANVQELAFQQLLGQLGGVDILILNTSFPSIDSDLAAARLIKKHYPEVVVISFGVFFTLILEESLPRDGSIDYAIVDEPEATFAELLTALDRGADPARIKGLLYLQNGRLVFTGKRELIEDLDTLPQADRSLLQNDRYVCRTTASLSP